MRSIGGAVSTACFACTACLAVSLPAALEAKTVQTKVVWEEGKAYVEVAVEAESKADLPQLLLPMDLWDAQGLLLQRTQLKAPAAGAGRWTVRFPLEKIQDVKKQHRLVLSLLHEPLDIDYYEEIVFSGKAATPVLSHGLRAEGIFPRRKVYLVLNLGAFPAAQTRDIPVTLTVRDGEDNVLFNRQAAVKPAAQPQQHLLEITPEAGAVGPFKLEVSIDSESHNVFFNAAVPFAQPNARMPVSGMEHGDPGMWFAAEGKPETYQTLELFPPGAESLYYSLQLVDQVPPDNPRISYDREVKHSGRQSLRIDYRAGEGGNAWSVQSLPGKPLYLSFWVKGNESPDELIVYFEDGINYTGAAWQRWASFSSARVGTLDFSGWRQFRVPVLGYGQQVSGTKGSTPKIDAPIRLLAFSIKSLKREEKRRGTHGAGPQAAEDSPRDEPRTIWIDDLTAETQTAPSGLLSLEIQTSDATGRLTPDGRLLVAVGSGHSEELKKGQLTFLARDGAGNVVWNASLPLPVPAEGQATAEMPLGELAAKKPAGPVEVEVTFQDVSRPGVRIGRPVPLKAARQAGIVHDFEEPIVFSSYRPVKAGPSQSRIVEGGADGAGHALALLVKPGEDASVLFHPELPGTLDSIEMMVRGTGRPVILQPWFIDSGHTGIWQRPYNVLGAEPLKVDWEGWRKVSVAAPPIPPYWGDKHHTFYRKPWYPLNFALRATLANDEEAVEILFDDLRVVTHLPEAEQLRAEIAYPEEHRIHAPGTPLQLIVYNFADHARQLPLNFTLTNSQGIARTGKLDAAIAAGAKRKVTLLEELPPGIYALEVRGLGEKPLRGCVMAVDVRAYFGGDWEGLLTNSHLLRRLLNLTTERVYLDWDNSEPAPNLIHANWFEQEVKRHREIQVLPDDLQLPAARQATARAAVSQGEQELRDAGVRAVTAEQNEKPAADRVAATLRNVEAARTELETAKKNLEAVLPVTEAAVKQADAARARQQKSRAEQQQQAAQNKVIQAEKALANDRLALDERRQALASAVARVEEITRQLEAARVEAAGAVKDFEKARSKYDFTLLPVVGFCADWAGHEAAEAIQRGAYMRYIPNILQVPRRMIDWSRFVRDTQREYKGRFDHWVLWENPDIDDSPQGIPPAKYAEMLAIFARWVKLYTPAAKVVAGGFNFNKSLNYLRRIPEAHRLPFDEIEVQMNLGELSPEQADVEGYLDDLNAMLRLLETGRSASISELDWSIGPLISPLEQAAYHARAALILDARGVASHQFALMNTGFDFDGYGTFYRVAYGNTPELQTFKPIHVPKPAYFALVETRRFLKDWRYTAAAELSDRSLADNRAYLYRNAAGEFTLAVWRAADGRRTYRLPAAWRSARARDVFGFPVSLDQGLPCLPLPVLVQLPGGAGREQILHDLRMLEPIDGSYPVLMDLHLAEPDSQRSAAYRSTGKVVPAVHSGRIAGDRKVRETYLHGLETEEFSFTPPGPGDVLLRRRWFFEGDGQKLHLSLNGGPEQAWNLGKGQGNDPGVRETTFVLRGCRAGVNRLAIRCEKPANCAGYRLEPLQGDTVPLVRWGVINTRQTRGQMMLHASAAGAPLTFGRTPCADGIGAHATSFIEYPLDGQFRAFEVTVGIDGSTEGRGSVFFRVYVDGKERANSGLMSGFAKPKTLAVADLENAQRLILNVTDAEDGNRDDLADWIDGKLYLKK